MTYLYDRTGGSVGSLRALLSDASIGAILGGEEQIGRRLLDMTSTDYAAEESGPRTPTGELSKPTLPMLIGRDCASPAIIGSDEISHRQNRTGLRDPLALTYPEQVKIARLLTRPTFLRTATNPDVDEAGRDKLTVAEVEKIILARGGADPWRATARVWTAIVHLTARRRDTRVYGIPDPRHPLQHAPTHLTGNAGLSGSEAGGLPMRQASARSHSPEMPRRMNGSRDRIRSFLDAAASSRRGPWVRSTAIP